MRPDAPSHCIALLVCFYHGNKRLETGRCMNRTVCLIHFIEWEGHDQDASIHFTSDMVSSFCALEEGDTLYLHMEKRREKKRVCAT